MPAQFPAAIASALAARCATREWPPPLRPQPSRWRVWARPTPGAGLPRPAVIPTHFVVGIHGWAPGGTRFPTLFEVGTRSPLPRPRASANHASLCPPSAGKAARVWSGGEPPAFLPHRCFCRKVPRPETGRPRHARSFIVVEFSLQCLFFLSEAQASADQEYF